MRQIREVLRLHHECGRTQREITVAVGLSKGAVSAYLDRAREAGLTWEQARDMTDQDVEARLFRSLGVNEPAARAPVDFAWVHREMRRKGVTLQLLWGEYAEGVRSAGGGARAYQYSQFCEVYASWRQTLSPTMRQTHRAGEKLFLDYSGKRPEIVDPATGEVRAVELFVAVMGASSFTFAEATLTQRLPDFIGSVVRALEFLAAVPEVLVPDQLRSAVSKPCRYEPEINATFAELGRHYGCAIIPARPRKPRDKAAVEGGVLLVQRWILACLRHERFHSLGALNGRIGELLDRLNARPFQKREGSRRAAFDAIDRPAMKPLPPRRFELGEWKLGLTVGIDYCVAFDHRVYSVPVALMGRHVDVRATGTMIEVFHEGARVALHTRSHGPKGHATIDPAHRPKSHREYGDWPPERMITWGRSMGAGVGDFLEAMLTRDARPELRYRAALGVLRLGKTYGHERLDAACRRALGLGSPSYRSVAGILKHNLDRVAPAATRPTTTTTTTTTAPTARDQVRGGHYFDREEDDDDA